MNNKYDYVIIGSGIIGLSIARTLNKQFSNKSILIIDKENQEAAHASSRNSGVLHAGFYYSTDSLKAKFTCLGNRAMKAYCEFKNFPINDCGKLVVAQNEQELQMLYELEKRGKENGSNVEIIDEKKAIELEPNIKTFKKALHSPNTASINPKQVCTAIKNDLIEVGVDFSFQTKYVKKIKNGLETSKGAIEANHVINCAGLYADQVAKDYGFGSKYTIIPFKGIYLKYTKNDTDIKMNIYPVPNLNNPFLGVHFTKTVTGEIKIGPTAIPALWREQYSKTSNFNISEFTNIVSNEATLFIKNSFGFRDLAFDEIKKYNKDYLIRLAQNMVKHIDPKGFTQYTKPGIRAQLLDKKEMKLVQDFVVEGDSNSTHILNAVSPAFTCALPFAEYVVNTYISPSK